MYSDQLEENENCKTPEKRKGNSENEIRCSFKNIKINKITESIVHCMMMRVKLTLESRCLRNKWN